MRHWGVAKCPGRSVTEWKNDLDSDQSRRPLRYANQLPLQVERLAIILRSPGQQGTTNQLNVNPQVLISSIAHASREIRSNEECLYICHEHQINRTLSSGGTSPFITLTAE